MPWLTGFLLFVVILLSFVLVHERAARRRRARLIRSSVERSQKGTRSQRSEMRGDSHHDTVVGLIGKTGDSTAPERPTTKRRRSSGHRSR